MYKFFISRPIGNLLTVTSPQYSTINEVVHKQRDRILSTYLRAPMTSLNNRQLDRLIKGFKVPITNDWAEYYRRVRAVADRHGSANGIVTPTRSAQITTDNFFSSSGVYEVSVSVEYPWKQDMHYNDIRAVRWLYHESTSTTMPIYNRQHIPDYTDTGIWVVGIDIALLMVQYHKWRYGNNGSDGVDKFIASVVLPGMIDSHFSIMLLNRLRLLSEGKRPPVSINQHQMAFPSVDRAIDTILNDYLRYTDNKRNLKYHQILASLPGFIYPTLWECAQIPEASNSNISNWARDIARLPMVGWLVRYIDDTGNSNNREFINGVQLYLRYLRQNNNLRNGLSSQYDRLKRWINYNLAGM